ncbi:Lar family restriction alleviation protein [Brucella intermedia]|uniref:Lar family restriction alleviation protein n=1 Tax=Brucella intermedia TaxID=94625 RepID=UPI00224B8707|nr:Lar family restriction alleviation protein [Brucella intermedia]
MASEMKPCPFCGGSNLSFRSTPDMDTDGKFHRISCNECGAGSREKFAMETCPLFYEELRSAWNTRPAPAATDTGLVTVEHQYWHTQTYEWLPTGFPDRYRKDGFLVRELVTRSQAEELLAAEREAQQRLLDIIEEANDDKEALEAKLAAKPTHQEATVMASELKLSFEFDRYVNGTLMAEGVTIERASTLDKAMVAAARIAPKGPNGETPVLVYRPAPAATDTGLETLAHMAKSRMGWVPAPHWSGEAVCLRSQAEELLAAERVKNQTQAETIDKLHGIITKLEADNAAKDKQLKEANHV